MAKLFGYKTEVMTIKEFMGRAIEPDESVAQIDSPRNRFKLSRKQATKLIVVTGAILLSIGFGDVGFAAAGAIEAAVTGKVINAFEPLVALVQALAYPVSLIMMLLGAVQVTIGHSERGLSSIQKAGAGFILCQMIPTLLDLLHEITKSL